jgi:hypothetical protein
MRVAAVNIQAGRINRSRFKKRLEGCKFAHMTAGVRCVLSGMMYVAKVRGGGTPNGFVIYPLIYSSPHFTSRTMSRGVGKERERERGRDDEKL